MAEALSLAHTKVFEQSQKSFPGSATTLTAAWVIGSRLYFIHVGDCRIYLRRNGTLIKRPITVDHTYATELGITDRDQLKQTRAANVLTQAVGTATVPTPQIGVLELMEGDTILMCSDGLPKVMSEAEVETELHGKKSLKAKMDGFFAKCKAARASDDVSLILLSYSSQAKTAATTTTPTTTKVTPPPMSPDKKILILQTMDFFKNLDFSEIQTLNGIAETETFPAGFVLIKKNAPATTLWVILQGQIELVDGAKLQSFGPGTCVGEPAFFRAAHTRMCTVQAKSPITALSLDREDWFDLTERNPTICAKVYENLAVILARKLRDTHEKYVAEITARLP